MRSSLVLSLVALGACGGSSTGTPDLGGDMTVDPNLAYEQAVLAASWVKLPNGPAVGGGAKQDDVFFLDPMVGYLASGPKGAVQKTTDGGSTWTSVFNSPTTYFRAVAFLDAQHGFAGNLGAGLAPSISDANVLYETKDAGASWSPVTAISGPMPKGLCNLSIIDSTHLVGVGRTNGPAFLLSSSDAGASWTSVDLAQYLMMAIDAHFSSPTEGLVVGMDQSSVCGIFRTTDGGKTFSQVFASATANSLCWKIQFPSEQTGYVAVQDTTSGPPTFAKTTDGGKTWAELPLPVQGGDATAAYSAIGIGFITDRVGWVSPEDASLPSYRTADGGQTWVEDPALKAPINRFRFVDKHTAYAVGGAVWKLDIAF